MIFTCPLISKSPNQSFGDCTKSTNYNWYHQHFQFPSKVLVLIFLFAFFQFYSVASLIWPVLFFFLLFITRSDHQAKNLYLKISENFVHLIFQDRFCVVHIPFVHLVKFQFLAQFLVNHLPDPVVSSLYSFCPNLLHSLIM